MKRPRILFFTVILALAFHAVALFVLKDVRMDVYMSRHSFMEHQGIALDLTDSELKKNEERIKREEQLAAIFREITRPSQEQKSRFDDQEMKFELFDSNVTSEIALFEGDQLKPYSDPDIDSTLTRIVSSDHLEAIQHVRDETKLFTSSHEVAQDLIAKIENVSSSAFDSMRMPLLPHEECGAIASSHDFSIHVEYSPKKKGLGYIFRLELIPREGAVFKRIKQNLFFLIDRSHSISETRYEASKKAVLAALKLLQPGDTFNILVFDNKISRLSKNNLPWDQDQLFKAEEFLKQQKYGGIFATTDLYSSIGEIVPEAVAENEVNTAILLSDGDTYLKVEKQRETIAKWTHQNAGKVSLYSLASGEGNNLPLLDILSTFNKGTLHYSASDAALEKSLIALIESIKNPIGKDILVTTISPEEGVCIKINPVSSLLPNLYEHIPYILYGSISQLQDFPIFFQGKYYDKWLDIKQIVSFKDAKPSQGNALERMWTMQQAYDDYAQFLKDGNRHHLVHAKRILDPYHIQIPFD